MRRRSRSESRCDWLCWTLAPTYPLVSGLYGVFSEGNKQRDTIQEKNGGTKKVSCAEPGLHCRVKVSQESCSNSFKEAVRWFKAVLQGVWNLSGSLCCWWLKLREEAWLSVHLMCLHFSSGQLKWSLVNCNLFRKCLLENRSASRLLQVTPDSV